MRSMTKEQLALIETSLLSSLDIAKNEWDSIMFRQDCSLIKVSKTDGHAVNLGPVHTKMQYRNNAVLLNDLVDCIIAGNGPSLSTAFIAMLDASSTGDRSVDITSLMKALGKIAKHLVSTQGKESFIEEHPDLDYMDYKWQVLDWMVRINPVLLNIASNINSLYSMVLNTLDDKYRKMYLDRIFGMIQHWNCLYLTDNLILNRMEALLNVPYSPGANGQITMQGATQRLSNSVKMVEIYHNMVGSKVKHADKYIYTDEINTFIQLNGSIPTKLGVRMLETVLTGTPPYGWNQLLKGPVSTDTLVRLMEKHPGLKEQKAFKNYIWQNRGDYEELFEKGLTTPVTSPDPNRREKFAQNGDIASIADLALDKLATIRSRVAAREGISLSIQQILVHDPDQSVRHALANNTCIDNSIQLILSADPSYKVRSAVASIVNKDNKEAICVLAADPEEEVVGRLVYNLGVDLNEEVTLLVLSHRYLSSNIVDKLLSIAEITPKVFSLVEELEVRSSSHLWAMTGNPRTSSGVLEAIYFRHPGTNLMSRLLDNPNLPDEIRVLYKITE